MEERSSYVARHPSQQHLVESSPSMSTSGGCRCTQVSTIERYEMLEDISSIMCFVPSNVREPADDRLLIPHTRSSEWEKKKLHIVLLFVTRTTHLLLTTVCATYSSALAPTRLSTSRALRQKKSIPACRIANMRTISPALMSSSDMSDPALFPESPSLLFRPSSVLSPSESQMSYHCSFSTTAFPMALHLSNN